MISGQINEALCTYAGALKDNCRGLLVGSRTYGKGLIQSIYELHDASGLALTVCSVLLKCRSELFIIISV